MRQAALFAALIALGLAGAARAADRTVTLAVANMSCASCPFIVKQSLTAVLGVASVEVSLSAKTARVTFDDSQASVEALTKATGDAGFPSKAAGAHGS